MSQYRRPTSSNLRAVRSANANTVIVAGEATSILRSDDAGQTWTQIEHTPHSRGGDVASMDFMGTNVICVGTDSKDTTKGRVWTATNGVLDFTTPDVDATVPPYTSVSVVSSDTYYGLHPNGMVEITVSGVTSPHSALPAGNWNSIQFLGTSGVGFAAGDGGQIAMFSGGSWTLQVTPAKAPQYNLKKIFFTDANHGFACGDQAAILTTTNGGGTWQIPNYASGGTVFHSLHFPVNFNTGWVVGDLGTLIVTINGGATWNVQSPGTGENLWDIWMTDNTTGFAVGDHGMVVRTIDGGTTWNRAPPEAIPDSLSNLNAVDFLNDGSLGLAAGAGGLILLTQNGGSSWAQINTGVPAKDLFGVVIPKTGSGNVAWACGAGGTIVKTSNLTAASPTWTTQASGTANTLRAILFPTDDNHGVVCGDGSTLLVTTAGSSWGAPTTAPATSATNWLALSSDPSGGHVYVAGTAGISAGSVDIGVHWANQAALPGGPPPDIQAVQSPVNVAQFAGATNNSVYKGDGVAAWSPTALPAGTSVVGLSFIDTLNGWAVNTPPPFTGGVFMTTDGNVSWSRLYVHTKWQLNAIWMSPRVAGLGYAVGQNGTILKTTSGGQ